MDDLRYKMIMALNAADLGSPLCEQVAAICAEIADQHCSELHVAGAGARAGVPEVSMPTGGRAAL